MEPRFFPHRENLAKYSVHFFSIEFNPGARSGTSFDFSTESFLLAETRIRLEIIHRLLRSSCATLEHSEYNAPACRWNFRNHHHSTSYAAAAIITTTAATTAIDIITITNIILENVILGQFSSNWIRKKDETKINWKKERRTEDNHRTATLDPSHTKAHKPKTFRAPPQLAPPIPLPRS